MAQFFIDPAVVPLSEMVRSYGTAGSLTIADDLGDPSFITSSGSGSIWTHNSIPNSAETEIVVMSRHIDGSGSINNQRIAFAVRANALGHYSGQVTGSNSPALTRWDGSRNTIAYSGGGGSSDGPENYFMSRVQITSGDVLRVRFWNLGDAEPSTWVLSTTVTEYASGKAGIGNIYGYGAFRFFGVGTDGDPAPTSPVATGPETPINPSITNLLATSARLNWEQG
jgi:hypothetical protein